MPRKVTYEQAEEIRVWFRENVVRVHTGEATMLDLKKEITAKCGLQVRAVENLLNGISHQDPATRKPRRSFRT